MPSEAIVQHLRCPLCGGELTLSGSALRCSRRHTFDLARQGYANLFLGRPPAGTDTSEMVAARADLLDAGHLDPIIAAVADRAAELVGEPGPAPPGPAGPDPGPGLVVDVGAGTGHYLAAVLDRLPRHHGVALDVAKAAARRAARAHPRAAAVVCDVWRRLPLADACADLTLDVFAPRNGAEFRRVLRPDGWLLVVTPRPDHLAELVGPLGLIRIDPGKAERLDRSLGGHLTLVDEREYAYQLSLTRQAAARFVAMGPSAWHVPEAALTERLAGWPEPLRLTVSVDLRTYRPLP